MPAAVERWRRGRLWDWEAVAAHLRRRPSTWQLMLVDVPRRMAAHIRLRRSPDLRFPNEVIEVKIANEYRTPDGHRRCDLFLRIVPTPPKGVASEHEGEPNAEQQ